MVKDWVFYEEQDQDGLSPISIQHCAGILGRATKQE